MADRLYRTLFLMSLIVTFGAASFGQKGPRTGTFPFGSFTGNREVIDLANNNVMWTIPIRHKAGRGTNFDYDLTYNSSVWMPVISGPTTSWQPVATDGPVAGWQGLGVTGAAFIRYSMSYAFGTCGQSGNYQWQTWQFSNFEYWDSGYHTFAIGGSVTTVSNGGSNQCPPIQTVPPAPWVGSTSDGSGFAMTVTPGQGTASISLTDRYGTQINAPVYVNSSPPSTCKSTTDINGNNITCNNASYTDTMNTVVLGVSGAPPASNTLLSYTAPSGATATYTVWYTNYTVATNFLVSGIVDYPRTANWLVGKIDLPDGSFYQFNYEHTLGTCSPLTGTYSGYCVTARVASVTLPTGGTITYSYSGGDCANNCGIFNDGSTATMTRQTPDGTWTYARARTGSNWQTTVTAPQLPYDSAANQTVIQFSDVYEVQQQAYQGSAVGTPLETRTTCYYNTPSTCVNTGVTPNILQVNVSTQLNGAASKSVTTSYDANENPTTVYVYDYPNGTTLLQKTVISYATMGCNVIGKPSSVTVYDGAAHTLSQTAYTYDQGTLAVSAGTPQHVASWCQNSTRGNLTTLTKTAAGAANITKTFTYYDTGMVKTATDVNNAVTTYNYPDATSTCGNTFATSLTLPVIGATPLTTYNCAGGVATQTQDLNGNDTNVTYSDQYFWRPASVQDPAVATTSYTYTKYTSSTSLASIESKLPFNGSPATSLVEQLTTLDGLGRPIYLQREEGPGSPNYDSIQTTYDVLGRAYQVTMPCVGGVGQGCSSAAKTTTTFDAMGRAKTITDGGGGTLTYSYNQNAMTQIIGPAPAGENTKRKQLQYDGLGRLVSVCEITTLSGSGTCAGQVGSPTGYLTTYTYGVNGSGYRTMTVNQNNQQTRTYTYDLVGRLIQETNPESGSLSYVYDSDSGGPCASGTYLTGNLVKTTDAVGNVTCYSYDQLHRILNVTYPSGSYAANTPKKYFVYDAATVNGTAMSNPKGQLAEAYTCTGSCTSKLTDLGFSYSARGEIVDAYESTPNSGGFYRVNMSYWENGEPHTLSGYLANGSTFVPTQTYSVDGEGRWSAVAASSGPNPVLSTGYNTASQITGITFGSNDSDAFTYDPNTGRMTQHKFTLNGSSVIGNLGWNPNWSLGTLAITDPFNSSNAQTCNYTHDDLQRISSANCGTAWSQTFNYDAFGNITKNGSNGGITWNPGYNSTTNRYTLAGTSYDANGNLTNDTFRSYAWNSNGKPVTIGSKTMTYDALDRMLEKLDGGTYTQFVYTPTGSLLAKMSGQSATSVRVPLPNAWAVYGSGNSFNHYEHLDWLGSSRLSSTQSRTMSSDIAYAPFGEAYASTATSGVSFTGMRSDVQGVSGGVTSGLYDFLARELPPSQGRWLSPDPAGLAAADPMNPQSWNRYAYTLNNPLALTDPLGLDDGYRCDSPSNSCNGIQIVGDCVIFYTYYFGQDDQVHRQLQSVSCTPHDTGDTSQTSAGVGFSAANNGNVAKSITSECIAGYNGSTAAKGVQFFSLYHLATDLRNAWAEWTLLPAGKYALAKTASWISGKIGTTEFLSVTGATSGTVIPSATSAVVDLAETAGKAGAAPAIAAATGIDLLVNAGCANSALNATGQANIPVNPGYF